MPDASLFFGGISFFDNFVDVAILGSDNAPQSGWILNISCQQGRRRATALVGCHEVAKHPSSEQGAIPQDNQNIAAKSPQKAFSLHDGVSGAKDLPLLYIF